MGFIPIFLTLGGFVFLFMMVVHQNFKQKKHLFESELKDLTASISRLSKSSNAALPFSKGNNIKEVERLLQSLNKEEKTVEAQNETNALRQKLGEVKMLRYNYNKLIETKPYSFVATVMRDHSI
ncbi:hypothetical protein [Cyclobacterium qasimii]|uniref:Uncharacterized protein n=2 Tax=Cyclobacterium qasimii TaxID=1350429 RepID=S7VEM2_9BACT|nr:hypothetical protein [Cyclobacterium qasimii]EPR68002.1 hypothetical protein ADICYQ_3074 [Cyclobacterium qasimii M12-11B]GEO22993.1 hypothetical protein CQA01_35270 [Cyclobacterium qasimii]